MKKLVLYFLFLLFAVPFGVKAQFENYKDSVIQLYGVVMSADSLQALPSVSIMVKGRNQGTLSNDQGVFSIVVLKGDEIEFSSVGYKPKLVKIPANLDGNQQSMIQLMVQDTVYLPATIIKNIRRGKNLSATLPIYKFLMTSWKSRGKIFLRRTEKRC